MSMRTPSGWTADGVPRLRASHVPVLRRLAVAWLGVTAVAVLGIGCGNGVGDLGAVNVSTVTTGDDRPTTPYSVVVDSLAPQSVSDGAPRVITGLPAGEAVVTLHDIPANCAVIGLASVRPTLVAGDTATVSFPVNCVANQGSMRLVFTADGTVPDGGEVVVRIGSTVATVVVPVGDSATVDSIPGGSESLAFSGLPTNCRPNPPFPTSVVVVAGTATRVSLHVTCAIGAILYQAGDRVEATDIDGSGQATIVSLSGTFGDLTASPDGTEFAYTVDPTFQSSYIIARNVDGSGSVVFVSTYSGASSPAWSPDGTKIAFLDDANDFIMLMDPDGSNAVPISTDTTVRRGDLAWAPSGTQIYFSGYPADSSSQGYDLYVMNIDGSGETRLTTDAPLTSSFRSCAISPDGSKLLFDRETRPDSLSPSNYEIFVMDTDGTNVVRLTDSPGADESPCWSPDGTKIVFASTRNAYFWGRQLFVMNADGSHVARIVSAGGAGSPVWR